MNKQIKDIDQKVELSEQDDTLMISNHYSQSQIDELVNESIQKELPIDTITELHSLSCGEIFPIKNFEIIVGEMDIENLEVFEISDGLKRLLYMTSCYKKIAETNNYTAYIFIGEDESHYSNQFILVTIEKATKKVHEIELSYLYGNEVGSNTINTLFTSNSSFKRTSIKNIKYPRGKVMIDSTIVTEESFKIDELGSFVKI